MKYTTLIIEELLVKKLKKRLKKKATKPVIDECKYRAKSIYESIGDQDILEDEMDEMIDGEVEDIIWEVYE
jgi:hypothetical protein